MKLYTKFLRFQNDKNNDKTIVYFHFEVKNNICIKVKNNIHFEVKKQRLYQSEKITFILR